MIRRALTFPKRWVDGFLSWRRKRKRANCLGDMGHAKLWHDPKTGDLWQATGRFSVFSVPSANDDLEGSLSMLETVHMCECYVDPEEYLE